MIKTYPLTESQMGVFLAWTADPQSTQYNLPIFGRLDSEIDTERLAKACSKLAEAHPTLKTRFVVENGEPRQYIDDSLNVSLQVLRMSEAESQEHFKTLLRPFDLLSGEPLARMELIETEETKYFFYDLHHSVGDGTSAFKIFHETISKIYSGEDVAKEEYTVMDYAEAEAATMGDEDYQKSKEHYAELFADASLLSLASNVEDAFGKVVRHSSYIPTREVDAWCSAHGVKASWLFQSAFIYVMSQYSHEEKFGYSFLTHGRVDKRLLNTIGMYVRTVPAVAEVDVKQPVLQFVHDMGKEIKAAVSHSNYPFTHFCRDYHQKKGVSFGFQGSQMAEEIVLDDRHYPMTQTQRMTTSSDLDVIVYIRQGQYDIRVEASEALYSDETAAQVSKCVRTCVLSMMANPDKALSEVSILDSAEKQDIIAMSAGPAMDVDLSETWVDLFIECAAKNPGRLAVADGVSGITYAQLNRRSDLIAQKLVALGVQKRDFVGVMTERSKEYAVCVLGIHKAGAAYLPLDLEYPDERLRYMLEDSGANVLITTHSVLEEKRRSGGFGADKIIFIDDIEWERESSGTEPVNLCTPDCYTYIIYTSGSTGQPKGVVLHHKGLRNYIASMTGVLELTADDRISLHRPFSFDAHIQDFYPVLTLGGSLHIMPEDIRKDMRGLRDFIVSHDITGGSYTTSLAAMLLESYPDLPLRYMTATGEKMTGIVSGTVQIYNGYGPTECTDLISAYRLERGRVYSDIPIGRPMANSWAFVVGRGGDLLPVGAAGELCFASDQVGVGYWHLPEKTSEAFGSCPFVPDKRMYRTGDLCRWNSEDQLEYLGRIDNQVKLRGFRIELGEIEAQAKKVVGVSQAVAVVREAFGAQRIVLYYTVKAGTAMTEEDIRHALEVSELAEYMVPELYVQLEEMPHTSSGKVNRRALPEPEKKAEELTKPADERERRLWSIAAEVLKHEQFGVTTNLISVGLNSLGAMRMSAAVSERLGVSMPTKDIMKQPTVRQLATLVAQGSAVEHKAVAHEKREYYPITENQRGVYADWEMNRSTTQYNIPVVMRFDGVSADRLRTALTSVVEAHPSLKARFSMRDGDVVQLRHDEEPVEITVTELEHEPDMQFFQSRVRPFDLQNDKLYRLEIYTADNVAYLFQDIHHSVFDGGSGIVFASDLRKSLDGEALRVETYTAFDRAIDEKDMQKPERYAEADRWFGELIGDVASAMYPKSSEPRSPEHRAFRVKAKCKRREIDAFCAGNGLTQSNYFLTALLQALHRLTHEDNLLITAINNGRSAPEMMDIIGMFVKTVPVRSDFDRRSSMAEAVRKTQEQLQETLGYDFYPWTRIVERYGVRPNILFAYQGGFVDAVAEVSADGGQELTLDTAKTPVEVSVLPTSADEYTLSIVYDGSLYSEHDMNVVAEAMKLMAEQSAAAKSLADIQLTSETERTELMEIGEGERMELDRTLTLVDMFERQAAATPDAQCVVFRDKSFSYHEVDELSTRLAVHLQRRYGVKQETAVGVMIDRSEWMVIYPLAVMKAGGAYMPLDFKFPAERLKFMCKDAGVKLILSEDNRVAEAMPDYEGDVLTTTEALHLPDTEYTLDPACKAKPENMYVILYTSGTTGQPKGAILEHRNIVNFCHWYCKELDVTAADHVLGYANFGFDAHMMDIYPAVTCGASVYIIDSEMRMDLLQMNAYMEENGVTVAFMTTQVGHLFATTIENHSLRVLDMGGEKLMPLAKPPYRCYNGYGPTECTIYASCYNIKEEVFDGSLLGRPLANCQLYVVDQSMNLLPRGAAGELIVAGAGVGRGYLNRPELTAEKFITFLGKPAYRTGDLARWSENGNIEFLGRLDGQVKLRGLRIELGEIEAQAAKMPGVRHVAACVRGVNGTQRLVLYYTSNDGSEITEDAFRKYLACTALTEFMYPDIYMHLEEMPLTANGKINRRALPEPKLKHDYATVPPKNQQETIMLGIVEKALKASGIGVTDDLRTWGLTSLAAIKIAAAAQRYGIAVKVGELLKYRTIRDVLNAVHCMCYFAKEREKDKPIVVMPLGYATYSHSTPIIEALSKRFSVFVIESIVDHYEFLFADAKVSEVAKMYTALLDTYLSPDDKVSAFMGLSFGGELAYRMALEWNKATGKTPPVMLGDTSWTSEAEYPSPFTRLLSSIPDSVNKFIYSTVGMSMVDYIYYFKISYNLSEGDTPEPYPGQVILQKSIYQPNIGFWEMLNYFFAAAGEDISSLPEDDVKAYLSEESADIEQYWNKYTKNLICHSFEGSHQLMFTEEFAQRFAAELWELVSKNER